MRDDRSPTARRGVINHAPTFPGFTPAFQAALERLSVVARAVRRAGLDPRRRGRALWATRSRRGDGHDWPGPRHTAGDRLRAGGRAPGRPNPAPDVLDPARTRAGRPAERPARPELAGGPR